MKKYSVFLILLLLLLMPSQVEAAENNLVITISTVGEAKVTHNLHPPLTASKITVQLISDRISNIVAIDAKGSILDTNQKDDSIRINTFGATSVKLTYNAQIISNDSGIWRISYYSNDETTVVLPPLAKILSVNNIPINIVDEEIVMPAGNISIAYTVREVTTKNFNIISDNINYSVEILTGSKISAFRHDSGTIVFDIDDNAPILLKIPNSLISSPLEISLNNKLIEYRNYYQNSTHSWIRIGPQESGSIKIAEKMPIDTIPREPQGGGCLIATATFGSELAPQVQQLRELRDNTLLQTSSGSAFMTGFNQLYYSFSPTIADWERQNPVFKESVKIILTPLLASLSILNYVDIDSDAEVLGYGIGIILLNIGMYFMAPTIIIFKLRRQF